MHAGGKYPAKSLFQIIAGIVSSNIDWTSGFSAKAFLESYDSLKELRKLDCGLAVSGGCFDAFSGTLEIGLREQALAYFLFRLLQKPQSLGTVPAIDWNAYASAVGRPVT